jgi:hypothetical protein
MRSFNENPNIYLGFKNHGSSSNENEELLKRVWEGKVNGSFNS